MVWRQFEPKFDDVLWLFLGFCMILLSELIQRESTTNAAKQSITLVIGAHNLRSGLDRVIQFNNVDKACSPSAGHAVQLGQKGQSPAADKTENAIPNSRNTETPAAIRPALAKGPLCCPPCVMCPQGAPAINAN